jgi:hypothetical protein
MSVEIRDQIEKDAIQDCQSKDSSKGASKDMSM